MVQIPPAVAILWYVLHSTLGEDKTAFNDFCDMGPPGRYCFPDLSGWHECVVNRTTGKMIDKVHYCPSKTRCVCFNGPPCPSSVASPCQPYKLPPPLPRTFTMSFNVLRVVESPMGRKNISFSGSQAQLLDEKKGRKDSFEHEWHFTLVLPGNGSLLLKFEGRYDEELCVQDELETFPRLEVPPYFSYNGTVTIGYRMCEQWIWRTGGHNPGQTTTFQSFYISNMTEKGEPYSVVSGHDQPVFVPVMIVNITNSPPPVKMSTYRETNITSFVIGKVDKGLFKVPSFC